jgi:glycine cleavage system H protein
MSLEKFRFTKEHEWVDAGPDTVRVGITDYAQHELGDVVYVELPPVGKEIAKSAPIANIESVKAVSDVYSPLSGTVAEINGKLVDHPELVNQDPYGEGWLFTLKTGKPGELAELMDAESYEGYLKGISGE